MLPSEEGGVARTTVLQPAICAGWLEEEQNVNIIKQLER